MILWCFGIGQIARGGNAHDHMGGRIQPDVPFSRLTPFPHTVVSFSLG